MLLNACKDIGLAVNTGKTTYMEIGRHRGMKCCIVFVLMGWSLLPMHCDLFKVYRAPPNLGIDVNTPIKFYSEAYFFRLEVL